MQLIFLVLIIFIFKFIFDRSKQLAIIYAHNKLITAIIRVLQFAGIIVPVGVGFVMIKTIFFGPDIGLGVLGIVALCISALLIYFIIALPILQKLYAASVLKTPIALFYKSLVISVSILTIVIFLMMLDFKGILSLIFCITLLITVYIDLFFDFQSLYSSSQQTRSKTMQYIYMLFVILFSWIIEFSLLGINEVDYTNFFWSLASMYGLSKGVWMLLSFIQTSRRRK